MDLKDYKKTRNTTKWTTNAGDELLVKHMETTHVQNTIILLSRKLRDCAQYNLGEFIIRGVKAEDWIELLQTELKYRKDPKSVCLPVMAQSIPAEIAEEVKKEEIIEEEIINQRIPVML